MQTVIIIGAMDMEIAALREKLPLNGETRCAGAKTYIGEFEGKKIMLLQCGPGKVHAAARTQAALDAAGASGVDGTCVINTGVAGALSDKLDIGDIVISKDLVQHDFDASAAGNAAGEIPGLLMTAFIADPALIKAAKEAALSIACNEKNCHIARIATGDQFIASKSDKERIIKNFDAYCVEMEGAAIAQTCFINDNTPFVVIRGMSDKANEEAGYDFSERAKLIAERTSAIVMKMIERL